MTKERKLKINLYEILPYVFILFFSVLVFLKPLGNSDELWNYNFAKNILHGNIPYKDFSIVQTPLSCYISALFMCILGDGLVAFKIITYLLFIGIAALVFDLCRKTTKKTSVAVCAMAIAMSAHFLCFIYNYNYLTTFVLLLIFELELKQKESLGANVLIGLLVGSTVLIKQNTGALIWIANFIICLRCYKKSADHKGKYICRVLLSLIPTLSYVIYMMLVGAFYDFWDYAVIGISTFTHRYTLFDFCVESTFFVPYLILIIVMYGMIGMRLLKTKINDYQFASLAFSIAWTSIAYPLADPCHVLMILIPFIPTFLSFYSFEKIKQKEIVFAVVSGAVMLQVMFAISLPVSVDFYISKLDNYKGILIDQKVERVIESVDDYISEKEKEGYRVRIADVSAVAYTIPINHYEKNWDMLLVGNIGSNSVQDLIESDKPVLYLLVKDESVYGLQDHYEMLNYIKDNYKRVDEIAGFYVYEGK